MLLRKVAFIGGVGCIAPILANATMVYTPSRPCGCVAGCNATYDAGSCGCVQNNYANNTEFRNFQRVSAQSTQKSLDTGPRDWYLAANVAMNFWSWENEYNSNYGGTDLLFNKDEYSFESVFGGALAIGTRCSSGVRGDVELGFSSEFSDSDDLAEYKLSVPYLMANAYWDFESGMYFGGGLGNQIFEYAFYLSVRDRFPNKQIFGIYDKSHFKEHEGGFEIKKVFDVKLPQTSLYAKVIMKLILIWNKFVSGTDLYCHNLIAPDYNAVLFNAFKMNKSFYEKRENWISFKKILLNDKNKSVADKMLTTNSVSLHVRRGDFLSSRYAAKHAGVATEKYYKDAVAMMKEKFDNPYFFVFSDDIPWCKENLNIDNVVYVDWNTGENSYIDMYLMTLAKANIIANSTFSYWGAYFNRNNPTVIFPERWKYSESKGLLDIFPENWVGIQS